MGEIMKPLMIIGTNSGCGKSFTVSALIRFLINKGYSVAPFKAQNISSNAVKIHDGKYIAASTYIQSQMAEIEPDTSMNPVLIKPNKEEMEIFLNGDFFVLDNYREYSKYLPLIKTTVTEGYRKLKEKYDIIVIEGAGGAAEINCLNEDVANNFMASIAEPNTIVVGDISLGGFFSAVHGTIDLMPEILQRNVTAFIVNKYYGKKSKLASGIEMIENMHNVKCIGVIPYMTYPQNLEKLKLVLDTTLSTEYNFDFLLPKMGR